METLFGSAMICFPFGPEKQRITASISHKFSLANRQSTTINKEPGWGDGWMESHRSGQGGKPKIISDISRATGPKLNNYAY